MCGGLPASYATFGVLRFGSDKPFWRVPCLIILLGVTQPSTKRGRTDLSLNLLVADAPSQICSMMCRFSSSPMAAIRVRDTIGSADSVQHPLVCGMIPIISNQAPRSTSPQQSTSGFAWRRRFDPARTYHQISESKLLLRITLRLVESEKRLAAFRQIAWKQLLPAIFGSIAVARLNTYLQFYPSPRLP